MAKLGLDKYYTNPELAKYCYDKTIEVLQGETIVEIIEPSAGKGVFLTLNPMIVGYDIEPDADNIVQADFLTLHLGYTAGRLFIGNPPFGSRMSLATKFFKKCTTEGDYISFILPISQLNNTNMLYEFDLVHSEDLGVQDYSGVRLHCVLNIYKRPQCWVNKKTKPVFSGVTMCRNDSAKYADFQYDVRMCAWGNATAGRILSDEETYSAEYKISVSEDLPNKASIVQYIKDFDWNGYVTGVAMKKIQQHHIVAVLNAEFQ